MNTLFLYHKRRRRRCCAKENTNKIISFLKFRKMKKNTFLLFTIVLMISLLTSCKKDPLDEIGKDEARMYGKIVEKGSKKPIKGARVYLRNCKCIFLGGCNCQVIDSLTTDDTGSYDFTYKYDGFDGHSFDIFVRVPEGFRQDNSPATLTPNTHDVVNYDVEIIPRAWVKVHVKNIKPFDEFDKIWISGIVWNNLAGTHQYYGKTTDIFLKTEVIGNENETIAWEITKNNILRRKDTTFYAIGHDTTYFEILY